MVLKIYKPTTPGRRKMSIVKADLTAKEPEKSLIRIKKKWSGRNNQGRITVRHRGGEAKRYLRLVDFKQEKYDIPAEVIAIEYDPNRTAFVALIKYKDEDKSYILAPEGLKVGDQILSSKKKINIKVGNRLPLEYIPAGILISNLELVSGQGGKIIRSAGSAATVVSVENNYAQVKMPSGEIRLVPKDCLATIGQISKTEHQAVRLGKAGRKRHLGIRPTVRGKAMNPDDHPHGGGEGNQPIGLTRPKTPWGKAALGVKTRKKGKYSDRFILQPRKR